MQQYDEAQQRKFHLINELYGCIMWHERCRAPNQTNEELVFWLSRELEVSEWPVSLSAPIRNIHLLKIPNIVGTVKERLFNLMANNPRCEFWARVEYGIAHNAAEKTNGVNEIDLLHDADDIIDEFMHRPIARDGHYGKG
jgi:hypothetical protein